MKIISNNIIPFKGFKAINLFGILFVRGDANISERLMRHEQIHSAQQKEMLWILFYLWYLVEWLIRVLFTKDRFSKDAYNHISFEQEAYEMQDDCFYLENRKYYFWIKYLKQ